VSRLWHDGEVYRARSADHESTELGMALEDVEGGKGEGADVYCVFRDCLPSSGLAGFAM
jgi:hypothetical protein